MSAIMLSKYKDRYDRGGCTIEQLQRLTALGALTTAEYKQITGLTYKAL